MLHNGPVLEYLKRVEDLVFLLERNPELNWSENLLALRLLLNFLQGSVVDSYRLREDGATSLTEDQILQLKSRICALGLSAK